MTRRLVFLTLFGFVAWLLWQTGVLQPTATAETTAREGKVDSGVAMLLTPTTAPDQATWNGQLPILMYHYIRDYTDRSDRVGMELSVSPTVFAEQLRAIATRGFTPVNLDYLTHPDPNIARPIVITFDDGYADAYTAAFTILRENGMTGTFYLVTDFIGRDEYLTWEQIRLMQQAGMSFGSHTTQHRDLTKLTTQQLMTELKESKQLLENRLGLPVTDFCYPSGRLNEAVVAAVQAAGYQTATTTVAGMATAEDQPWQLPRIRMTTATDLTAILTAMTQTLPPGGAHAPTGVTNESAE